MANERGSSHPLVVSLRKSGTHLVKEMMNALGYSPFGEVFVENADLRVLKPECVWRVASIVYPPPELAELARCTDPEQASQALRRALAALNEIWRERLAVPWVGGEMVGPETRRLADRVRARHARLRFSDLPDGICWILHQLPLDRIDGDFVRDWLTTGEPRVILNYRDPRDILLSMVEFLSDDRRRGVGGFPEHLAYAEILRPIASLEERLAIALTDPCFPGARSFEDALWLRRHPRVCAVTFEDLVGPAGGGSEQRQVDTVRRVTEFLGQDVDPRVVAEKVFNRESFTFRSGRVGRWREVFTPRHVELFEQRHGAVLDAYHYA
jgi:hypothetical protein